MGLTWSQPNCQWGSLQKVDPAVKRASSSRFRSNMNVPVSDAHHAAIGRGNGHEMRVLARAPGSVPNSRIWSLVYTQSTSILVAQLHIQASSQVHQQTDLVHPMGGSVWRGRERACAHLPALMDTNESISYLTLMSPANEACSTDQLEKCSDRSDCRACWQADKSFVLFSSCIENV